MTRVYNFAAGPAVLPESVLQQAQQELLNWHGMGASVMELSHRSREFVDVAETCEQDLRELLHIPERYKVLFLQGGAFGQFSAIPLNILGEATEADYIESGIWSKKAIECAMPYAKVNVIASNKNHPTSLPDIDSWQVNAKSAYLHYCPNETINGLAFNTTPDNQGLPLVADMSSCILSQKVDISQFGLIYAGAQKNIGPAGLVIVIVDEALLGKAHAYTPTALNYAIQAAHGSMLNTPPTFTWYMVGLVFKWLKAQGGVEAIEQINQQKATLLYQTIDNSEFYHNDVDPRYRSRMNVPFRLQNAALQEVFLQEAKQAGLINLEGHRSVGGMRASIYNAMPLEGVKVLCDFMHTFAKKYG